MISIAVDFDLTLAEGDPLRWRANARDGLQALYRAGHRLILHSRRCTPLEESEDPDKEAMEFYRWGTTPPSALQQWAYFDEMRSFLKREGAWGLFHEVWQRPGKPGADLFIDDRLESPDWARLARELGVIQAP